MKKLLFVAFALLAATLVIGLTAAFVTRSGDADPEISEEDVTTA